MQANRNVVDRVTFWGVTDAHSWKNNWPMQSRTDYTMLFDRNYDPKPVFRRVTVLGKTP
jgi:endo-1,4-beta-xylanase